MRIALNNSIIFARSGEMKPTHLLLISLILSGCDNHPDPSQSADLDAAYAQNHKLHKALQQATNALRTAQGKLRTQGNLGRYQLVFGNVPDADGALHQTLLRLDSVTGNAWTYDVNYILNTNISGRIAASGWTGISNYAENVQFLMQLKADDDFSFLPDATNQPPQK